MLALASSTNKQIFIFSQKVIPIRELLGSIWALLFSQLQNEHKYFFAGKVISQKAPGWIPSSDALSNQTIPPFFLFWSH